MDEIALNLAEAVGILAEAGIETPRLEARVLLACVLGVSHASVIAGIYPAPTTEQAEEFARLIDERAKRAPLAYLRGTQEFYGLDFAVSPAVLIPRPETEMLVEAVLKAAAIPSAPSDTPFRIADVGTGTGCIPISAAKNHPNLQAVAFDLSADALAVAQGNAARHGVSERVQFVQGDLLAGVAPETFDFIASNPPYIPQSDMADLQPEVRDFEPRMALVGGGADGMDIYRRLIPQAWLALRWGSGLAVEVGQGQAAAVRALFERAGFAAVETQADFAGIGRVVSGKKIKSQ